MIAGPSIWHLSLCVCAGAGSLSACPSGDGFIQVQRHCKPSSPCFENITKYYVYPRGVETVGPVSPVGHGHLRSDSSTDSSDQMFERTPDYLKCYFGDISACICPTAKYDLWNRIRILQTVHICIHLGVLGPFCTWKFIQKVRCNCSVWLT